jgi:DNA-binding transcriptional LysR family regulator
VLQFEDLSLMRCLMQDPSLSSAARQLRVSTPAISMRLKKLEAQLGMSLAVRSTRRLMLTAEGQKLAEQAEHILAQLDLLPDTLKKQSDALQGQLKITAPFGFGRQHVAAALAQFSPLHPEIQSTLELLESPWPDKRDADAVIHIGAVRDSSWVAHLLARNARWVCASPNYLRKNGTPAHPRELSEHATLCIRENEEDVTLWHYKAKRGASQADQSERSRRQQERYSVRLQPKLLCNDGEVARNWALAGLGIVMRSQWDVQPFVASGKLVRLFANYEFDNADILALVPPKRHHNARVQAWITFLKKYLAQQSISTMQKNLATPPAPD